jgi:DNA-binding NtrC family response regulator
MVKAPEINLAELLRFEPERGLILLKDYRMVMFSASALGAQRKEIIDTLGWDQARGLMKRFGYAAGLADGLALAKRFPAATGTRHMDFGAALHALEGAANVVRIPERSDTDLERGRFHVEGYWENSFEAEQHLELLGPAQEPVCWTLVGYAVGHSSAAAQRPTVVVETECRAMGHHRCRFTAAFADEMVEEAQREEAEYQPRHLPPMLQDLLRIIERQKGTLRTKEREISRLQTDLARTLPATQLIGSSASFALAIETARAAAPFDTTALLLGESGTGKEPLARLIHEHSPRSKSAFVAVNCSALPESLQEAELFGHAKGAFTGASTAGVGLFEAASGGTLFLDEIGDLSPTAQAKILRALQEGEVKRLGETRSRKVDVRVIAATNRDLEAMVAANSFREDLYYRLNVVVIELPPLRERKDDALLLAEHFFRVYRRRFSKRLRRISGDAKRAIAAHSWPGNVRELENAIERAVVLAQGTELTLADLPDSVARGPATPGTARDRPAEATSAPEHAALEATQGDDERIGRALELTGGNRRKAAALLGVSRTTLWRRTRAMDK